MSMERIPVDPTWEHAPTASLTALRTQIQEWLALPMKPACRIKNQDERYAQRELEPEEEEIVQRQIEGFLDQTRPIWSSTERPDPKQVKAIAQRLNDFGKQHPRTAMKFSKRILKS